MIENWYLADIHQLSKTKNYLRDIAKQKNYEGKHGKNELKALIAPGYSYSETKHGPELFIGMSIANARKFSKSLDDFIKKAGLAV